MIFWKDKHPQSNIQLIKLSCIHLFACIILNNKIVEDKQHTYEGDFDYFYDNVNNHVSTTETSNGPYQNLKTILQTRARLHEKRVQQQLQTDLI